MEQENAVGTSLMSEENKKRPASVQNMDLNFDHVCVGLANANTHNLNPSKTIYTFIKQYLFPLRFE